MHVLRNSQRRFSDVLMQVGIVHRVNYGNYPDRKVIYKVKFPDDDLQWYAHNNLPLEVVQRALAAVAGTLAVLTAAGNPCVQVPHTRHHE